MTESNPIKMFDSLDGHMPEYFERGNVRAKIVETRDSDVAPTHYEWWLAIKTDDGTALIKAKSEESARAIYTALFDGATGY